MENPVQPWHPLKNNIQDAILNNEVIPMQPITYSLKDTKGNSSKAYTDIHRATCMILLKANQSLQYDVEDYQSYVHATGLESCRSFNEYMLELIMLGVLWRSNEKEAGKTTVLTTKVLHQLYLMRRKSPCLKPAIDTLRGKMISSLLYHEDEPGYLDHSYSSFYRLLNWLDATGEYTEEVKRLNGWFRYAGSMDEKTFSQMISKAYNFAGLFEDTCRDILGDYTKNVGSFVENARKDYKYREDYALATRKEVEYHLNMVGAEILNMELSDRFIHAKRKIVLLPTCMRSFSAVDCKASKFGHARKCTNCNPECNIGKIRGHLRKSGIDVYLIPHSSDFSRFLKQWRDEPDIALVGIACVLNLLMGGYEMINLGIASQCVYLDHCGCKKHWDKEGAPTSINTGQLLQLLGLSNEVDVKEIPAFKGNRSEVA